MLYLESGKAWPRCIAALKKLKQACAALDHYGYGETCEVVLEMPISLRIDLLFIKTSMTRRNSKRRYMLSNVRRDFR